MGICKSTNEGKKIFRNEKENINNIEVIKQSANVKMNQKNIQIIGLFQLNILINLKNQRIYYNF